MTQDELMKVLVPAMESGLQMAKISEINNIGPFNNSLNFRKMDDIFNSINNVLANVPGVITTILHRGSYKVLLIYNEENGCIYNVISRSNLNTLMSKKSIEDRTNYNFSLFQFNGAEGVQTSYIDVPYVFEELAKGIQYKVEELVDGAPIKGFKNIVMDMQGLRLSGVRVIEISNHGDLLSDESYSDLLSIDYDISSVDDLTIDEDIPITIKPEYLDTKDEIKIYINKEDEEYGNK